jgi:anaphase-promoting complex subunit 6
MQNLQLGNLRLAKEYLKVAWDLCKEDPLLLNELGVVFYHEDDLEKAIDVFHKALEIAQEIGSEPRAWIATRANLGHAFRRVGKFPEALEQFDEVLRQGGKDASAFCAKGLVLMEMGAMREATVALHEALATSPQDPVATDLLNRAMDAFDDIPVMDIEEEDEFERKIRESAAMVRGRRGIGRRRGRIVANETGEVEGESMVVDEGDT